MCQGKNDKKRGKGDAPTSGKGDASKAGKGTDAMLAMMAEMQRTIAALQAQVENKEGNKSQR